MAIARRDINPKQKEFFNEKASTWDQNIKHDHGKLDAIVDLLSLKPADTVLDVGTGTGITIPFLERRVGPSGRIVCVDYAENMIKVAKRKFPAETYQNITFIVSDVNTIPIRSEYDAVLCYSCFPHFIDQLGTVAHLAKGLKPDGRLMVAHSQSRAAINKVHTESGEVVEKDYLPTMAELEEMMRSAGLRVGQRIDDSEKFVIVATRP